jgi:hypothetical protein
MSRSSASSLHACLASTVLLTALASCSPPNAATPATAAPAGLADLKPGEVIPFSYLVNDREARTLRFRIMQLEEPGFRTASGEAPTPVTVLESDSYLDGSEAEDAATATATPEAVRAFLKDQWDAHVGGVDDAGVNGAEFVRLMTDTGMDPALFLKLYQASRLSLPDFVELVTIIDTATGNADDDQGVRDVHQALHAYGLTLGDLVAVLNVAAGGTLPADKTDKLGLPKDTAKAFFQTLAKKDSSLATLLAETVAANRKVIDSVRQVLAMSTLAYNFSGGFVFKTSWISFIYGKVIDEGSFVLNEQDRDPANYSGGREVLSDTRTATVGTNLTPLAQFKWQYQFKIDSTHPTVKWHGQDAAYIQDIRPKYSKTFQTAGWKVRIRNQVFGGMQFRNPDRTRAAGSMLTQVQAELISGMAIWFEDYDEFDGLTGITKSRRSLNGKLAYSLF